MKSKKKINKIEGRRQQAEYLLLEIGYHRFLLCCSHFVILLLNELRLRRLGCILSAGEFLLGLVFVRVLYLLWLLNFRQFWLLLLRLLLPVYPLRCVFLLFLLVGSVAGCILS